MASSMLLRAMSSTTQGSPVMWRTIRKLLEPLSAKGKLLVADGTLGTGGHSYKILKEFPEAYVVGCDLDKEMVTQAEQRLSKFKGRYSLHQSNYTELHKLPRFPDVFDIDNKHFDLVLLEPGVSPEQLANPDRGFSYSQDGPLDMRYNQEDELSSTAEIIVNNSTEKALIDIFNALKPNPVHKPVADLILRYCKSKRIQTTKELCDVLNYAFFLHKSQNRFKDIMNCFDALRVYVNNDLKNLEDFLEMILPHVDNHGQVACITYHIPEDNKVKRVFEEWHGSKAVQLTERLAVKAKVEDLTENDRNADASLRFCIKEQLPTTMNTRGKYFYRY